MPIFCYSILYFDWSPSPSIQSAERLKSLNRTLAMHSSINRLLNLLITTLSTLAWSTPSILSKLQCKLTRPRSSRQIWSDSLSTCYQHSARLAIYTLTKADGNKAIQERARTNAVNRKYSIKTVPTLSLTDRKWGVKQFYSSTNRIGRPTIRAVQCVCQHLSFGMHRQFVPSFIAFTSYQ
jgi:hypothetical protein